MTELTAEQVVQAVRCPEPYCRAPAGRPCRLSGGVYGEGGIHASRWQKVQRQLRLGRIALPLAPDRR